LLSSADEVNYLASAGVWTLLSRKVNYPILIGERTFQRVSVSALLSSAGEVNYLASASVWTLLSRKVS
jgi:hypothetical protein